MKIGVIGAVFVRAEPAPQFPDILIVIGAWLRRFGDQNLIVGISVAFAPLGSWHDWLLSCAEHGTAAGPARPPVKGRSIRRSGVGRNQKQAVDQGRLRASSLFHEFRDLGVSHGDTGRRQECLPSGARQRVRA
jgi:hypothetical protein